LQARLYDVAGCHVVLLQCLAVPHDASSKRSQPADKLVDMELHGLNLRRPAAICPAAYTSICSRRRRMVDRTVTDAPVLQSEHSQDSASHVCSCTAPLQLHSATIAEPVTVTSNSAGS
jgi:hypothetical protein